MVESSRIKELADQIKGMSAADMKAMAKFGKVSGYAPEYADLKETLRSFLTVAKNVHGVDMADEFEAVPPIKFFGMIRNEVFVNERDAMAGIAHSLAEKVAAAEYAAKPAALAAPASPLPLPSPPSRIFVSEVYETEATADLKRCLLTADYEPILTVGPGPLEAGHLPYQVIEDMKSCHGALICLNAPTALLRGDGGSSVTKLVTKSGGAELAGAVNPENDKSQEPSLRSVLVQHAMLQLGAALALFPERVFFVVQKELVDDVPATFRHLIALQTSGGHLSFDDGQRLVLTFKKTSWNE
ncbi:MAG: hypothetical protein MRY63_01285 [Neomegalonema sp.]|nr:hypothetical protein [Neomegalonema sp.]